MRENTDLANWIETMGMAAQYDASCKALLSNRYILAWILKSVVWEF